MSFQGLAIDPGGIEQDFPAMKAASDFEAEKSMKGEENGIEAGQAGKGNGNRVLSPVVLDRETVRHISGYEARRFYYFALGGMLLGLLASLVEIVVPIPGFHVFIYRWGLLITALLFGVAVFPRSANLIRRAPAFREFLLLLLPVLAGVAIGMLFGSFLSLIF